MCNYRHTHIHTHTIQVKAVLEVSHEPLHLQLLRPQFGSGNEGLAVRIDQIRSVSLLAALKVHEQVMIKDKIGVPDIPNITQWRILINEELKNMGLGDPEGQPHKIKTEIDKMINTFYHANVVGNMGMKSTQCPACISLIGAMVAQEVVKSVTHMYSPISQFYLHHAPIEDTHTQQKSIGTVMHPPAPAQVAAPGSAERNVEKQLNNSVNLNQTVSEGSRSDGQNSPAHLPYSADVQRELSSMRVFVVGAGAIGCELLKNFALIGIGTAVAAPAPAPDTITAAAAAVNGRRLKRKKSNSKARVREYSRTGGQFPSQPLRKSSLWSALGLADGGIILTDMDSIERSNLNRQLLFRTHHIGLSKAEIAAREVVTMNKALNGRVVGLKHRVGPETDHIFDSAFWEDTDIVVTALVDYSNYIPPE